MKNNDKDEDNDDDDDYGSNNTVNIKNSGINNKGIATSYAQ